MAGIWNKAPCWSVTLVFLTYVYMCWGCTPPEGVYTPPKMEEKIYYSDIFAYGKVKDIYKGGYKYDSQYTVNFEVYCIFKGDPLPQTINITRAGHEPGLCFSNNFTKGMEYFVYMNADLSPNFNEDEVKNSQEIDDIPFYCEAEMINYPIGVTEDTASKTCPEPYPDYTDCIKHTTTVEPEPSVVVKTMAPKDMPDDGESQTGQAVSLEDGDGRNTGGRAVIFLGVTALCLVLAVL